MTSGWRSLIGHEWATQLLHDAVQHDRAGHAYLFTGPEHIGKTKLAHLFASALNCDAAPAERPCGQCRPCRLTAADRHPDVRLLEPAISGRGKRTLKIDEIRELQKDLSLAPYEARHKIAILPYFEAATPGAANAFLKTLEEPPGSVILLLTATETDALLPTITSRCRILGLRPLPVARVAAALAQHWEVHEAEAERLAHLSNGRIGWAVQAINDPDLLQTREEQLETLYAALGGRRVARFALAEKLARDAENLPDLLRTWLGWWRDVALLRWNHGGDAVVNIDQLALLRRRAQQWPAAHVVRALQQTKTALWQLEHNANTRLVVENLFLAYPFS